MVKEKFQAMWNSRLGLAIIMFVIGGVFTYLFLPTKIKVEIKTETVYVDKIIEKEVIKVVEKEVIKYEKVKVVKRKITYPDGTIDETEIYESESQQVDRMKESYEELMKESEKRWEEKYQYLKLQINPRYLTAYGGVGMSLSQLQKPYYLGGFSYTFWGPFTIGAQATSQPSGAITVGIRF